MTKKVVKPHKDIQFTTLQAGNVPPLHAANLWQLPGLFWLAGHD